MGLLPAAINERTAAVTLAIGWALVWFLGQGLLIGLVVASFMRLLNRRSADLRYGVACAGLIAMAVCPVYTAARSLAVASMSQSKTMASIGPAAIAAASTDRL